MAEGWVRHLAPAVAVESADTRPAGLSRHAVAVMAEAGADISVQCSKLLSATAWRDADIAVTLCGSAREHWPIADPVAAPAGDDSLAPFRTARDEIRARVEALPATVENK